VWFILQSTGVFNQLDGLLQDVLGEETFTIESTLSLASVALFAVVVAVLNIVIGTALGAITSMLYNFSVRLTGGLLVGFTNQ
jgi:hypothetical protein